MTELLSVKHLSKTFGDLVATDDVSFSVNEGETTAIIGPNGAGKTTLINLLTGQLVPSGGQIVFLGTDITDMLPHRRVRAGIGRSFQLVNIFPRLSVLENVAIPALSRAGKSTVLTKTTECFRSVYHEAREILDRVGLAAHAHKPAAQLSHGDQHLIEIAMALATRPRLLVLDEPTAGMNHVERETLLKQLKAILAEGAVTLVIVEHDMDVVFSLANKILVLHQGQKFAEGDVASIRRHEGVREIYLGEGIEGVRRDTIRPKSIRTETLLSVDRIDTYYGQSQALHSISLEVKKGGCVALLGRNGVGKTTTLRSIMGLSPPRKGTIQLHGKNIASLAPHQIAASGVGYVPEGSRIFPNLTTRQNLLLPYLALNKRTSRWSEEVILRVLPKLAELKDRKAGFLSGGERKMLAIGRALMVDPEILLLDEPSEGLSPLMVGTLLDALIALQNEGISMLIADQNLAFASEVAEDAYLLDKGAVIQHVTADQLHTDHADLVRHLTV